MRSARNFSEAASICSTNGMTFFIMNNDAIYSAFKTWTNALWGAGQTPSWVMNGARSARGFWGLFTSPTTALYSGFTFGRDLVSGAACLTLERDSTRTVFTAYATGCDASKTFFCEFI